MNWRWIGSLFFLTWCMLTTTQAQNSEIVQHYRNGSYEDCLALCTAVLDTQPGDAQANFFKGASLVNLARYQEGQPFLINALNNQFATPMPYIVCNCKLTLA